MSCRRRGRCFYPPTLAPGGDLPVGAYAYAPPLPASRQALYNHKRNSKIYSKALTTSRSVDADELFWSSAKSR